MRAGEIGTRRTRAAREIATRHHSTASHGSSAVHPLPTCFLTGVNSGSLAWNFEIATGAPVYAGTERHRRQYVTEHAFDALTRSLGRRRAVQSLAAAAAMTLNGVALAGAKSNNGNKKQNKKLKKKALALCATQVSQCLVLVGDDAQGAICCQKLADCDFDGLITCLMTA